MINERFTVLDGWRGISILLVLACHLMPLGPKHWELNNVAGLMGMSLFLTLSGFLITHFLLYRPNIFDFLIRRLLRILPLAWLYIVVSLLIFSSNINGWLAHLLLYVNYVPYFFISNVTEHLWSLCVEIHFYLGIALLVAVFKRNSLLIMPLLCILVTLTRIIMHAHVSVLTHLRVDEILAGAVLALIYNNKLGKGLVKFVTNQNVLFLIVLLVISSYKFSGFMMYLRPYFSALLVGSTLFNSDKKIAKFLENKVLVYIATISYALYILHPLLASTWLGSGFGWDKYLKRPLLFIAIFFGAHCSTFYFEKHFIALGKKVTNRSLATLKYAKR